MYGRNICCEGDEAQVAQEGAGCPMPGNLQGQVGKSPEQPGLVGGVSGHGWEAGTG